MRQCADLLSHDGQQTLLTGHAHYESCPHLAAANHTMTSTPLVEHTGTVPETAAFLSENQTTATPTHKAYSSNPYKVPCACLRLFTGCQQAAGN